MHRLQPFSSLSLRGSRHPMARLRAAVGAGSLGRCLVLLVALAGAPAVQAQFDPGKVKQEPPLVASRYPDPPVVYPTPGFALGRTDFASHTEVMAFLRDLSAQSRQVTLTVVGQSQQGRDIPLVMLSSMR